jgi:hypothetical protein
MEDFSKYDFVSLRNLYLAEAREYLAALTVETSVQLDARREKLKAIDEAIQQKKPKKHNWARSVPRLEKKQKGNPASS